MCAVSAVGDDWSRRDRWPGWPAQIPFPTSIPENGTSFRVGQLEKELAALRSQVEQMRAELEAAKQQDIENGTPDCEMEDKVIILKKIAQLVGVDLSKVFNEQN